jgi:hypothetical protein
MKKRLGVLIVLVLLILAAAVPVGADGGCGDCGCEPCPPPDCGCEPCPPPDCGCEGCTPGYWKNHDGWEGYDPTDDFETESGVTVSEEKNWSLGDALSAKNKDVGSGPEAALMRHAVAALLNAANPGVNYAASENEVIGMVQDAYDSGDFEDTKNEFESWNEAGCPLN